MNYANVHVHANADNVAYHCPHDDGTHSYRLTSVGGDLTVYLGGTTADLCDFAHALLVAVTDPVPA